MNNAANGTFAPDAASTSDWTQPSVASGDAGGGLSAFFNRGTLMSQVVTRFVGEPLTDTAPASTASARLSASRKASLMPYAVMGSL